MFGKNDKNIPQSDLEVFAIFDTKTNSYKDPIFAVNKFDLYRQYQVLFKNHPQDLQVSNAEDFQAFKIGHYFRKTGTLTTHEPQHQFGLLEVKTSIQMDQKGQAALSPT